jgi:hypothetical protein
LRLAERGGTAVAPRVSRIIDPPGRTESPVRQKRIERHATDQGGDGFYVMGPGGYDQDAHQASRQIQRHWQTHILLR